MTRQIDLHLAVLACLKDGKWRTSTDVKLHPSMRGRAAAHQIGKSLHALHDLGLVVKDVYTVGGRTRMWRLDVDKCQQLTYIQDAANAGEQHATPPPDD